MTAPAEVADVRQCQNEPAGNRNGGFQGKRMHGVQGKRRKNQRADTRASEQNNCQRAVTPVSRGQGEYRGRDHRDKNNLVKRFMVNQ